jgi:CelD/BcsL family acetyltransferase involved in cellulose biosynthesis
MNVGYRVILASGIDATLAQAWRSAQAASAAFHSPCFSPEFTMAVAAVRTDVRIAVIENDGRAAGFFPHQRAFGGVGKPVGGPLSDFHGVLAAPGCRWELEPLMRACRLSLWSFDHLVENAAGHAPQFEPYTAARAPSPQIGLAGGYEQFARASRAAGSSYIPKTEGLARKLGREAGALSFTLHDPDPAVLRQLIGWKSEQYLRSGIGDVFSVPWTGALLAHIARMQGAEFAGVCSVLRAGGRIVAAHMGMRSREVMHYWFPAYDPEYSKYSAGIILLLRMAEALAAEGVRTIDLGKGEDPYKQRLMTGAVEVREGAVELPSLAAAARGARRGLEAWVRRSPLAGLARIPGRWLTRLERRRRLR